MSATSPTRKTSTTELIALTAFAMSLVAMSIDAMLPALGTIASDFGARGANDRQLVLTAFFVGNTFGQLAYGPLADATGRKRAMYAGVGVLMLGTLMSLVAPTFSVLLAGRLIAGLGAAGPRVVSVAIVRDLYAGRTMARLMSLVAAIFILVPIVAPSVGQGILLFGSWRAIFAVLLVMAVALLAWFSARQVETLPVDRRTPLAVGSVWKAFMKIVGTWQTLGYSLAAGFVFGALVAYLGTAQQIFGEQYGLGAQFPLYFAALAAALGAASLLNARLVERFGMVALSGSALRVSVLGSTVFLVFSLMQRGQPPLAAFMAYMLLIFFCNGLLFGNFNALAMEPMGEIAGSAAAVIGFLTSLVSVSIGTLTGRAYDGTVVPLVGGFFAMGLGALIVTYSVERSRRQTTTDATP